MNRSHCSPLSSRLLGKATLSSLLAIFLCPVLLVVAGCAGAEEVGQTPVSQEADDTTAQPPESTAKKTGPLAKEEVTIDLTPRPPATAAQAAGLLDLRILPLLKNAHVPGDRKSIGKLHYSAPDDVATAFRFHCEQLKKEGWKELPGTRVAKEYSYATFTQKGFLVYVSISSYGRGPEGESGWSSVSLSNHGNVSVGTLPVPKGATKQGAIDIQASYVTMAPLKKTAQECRRLLLEADWQRYGENEDLSHVGDSYSMDFKRNAVLLSVNISTHENQPGKTFIHYATTQLTVDIPAPQGVSDFNYSDFSKQMSFYSKDSAQEITSYYVKALRKLGWKPTTEEVVTSDRGRNAMMVFQNEAGDRIDLDMDVYDDRTRVQIHHLNPDDVAEIDRQIKELAEKKKQKQAELKAAMDRRRQEQTSEFPLPSQAKEFELTMEGASLEIIMPGGTGPKALADLRAYFKKAGWEEETFSVEEHVGRLNVKRDREKILINYMNIDKSKDFDLDVSCFNCYVKPVKTATGE